VRLLIEVSLRNRDFLTSGQPQWKGLG
jgi:hypothetical protein